MSRSPVFFCSVGSERPSLKYLYRHVRDSVATKWKNIGIELLEDKDIEKLDTIRMNNSGNVIECCGEMLELWLRKQPEATWNQLLEALRSPAIQLNNIASELEEMLLEEPTAKGTPKFYDVNLQLPLNRIII